MGVESLENRGRRLEVASSFKGREVGEKIKLKKKRKYEREKSQKQKNKKKKEKIHIKMFRCRKRAKLTKPRK